MLELSLKLANFATYGFYYHYGPFKSAIMSKLGIFSRQNVYDYSLYRIL